ncbi:50S ribosomal protein L3 [Nymphon striatum]|nr:50S ribosomal protein L3 [Nymphon striatum]
MVVTARSLRRLRSWCSSLWSPCCARKQHVPKPLNQLYSPEQRLGRIAPSDTVEPVAAGLNMSDLARTMLAPVTIVATDLVTGEALILRSAEGGSVDAEQLRGLQSFALDSSGEWLAAMGDGSPGFDLGSLWIGPLGGDLERLATGVGTFAWHDSSPQEMAVLSDPVTGQAQIVTFRVPNPHAESVRLRPTRSRVGALEAWGKWGYAVRLSPGAPTFDIVTPSFAMLAANQPGRLVGTVQGSRIMYSPNGDTGRPLMINSDSGIVYPIGALLEPQRVWNIAEGGLDGLVAVQTSNHATGLDSTLVVDGTVILAELDASAGVRPMQWDPSGTQLYTMSQEPDVGTQIEVFDTRTQVTTVPVPCAQALARIDVDVGLREPHHTTEASLRQPDLIGLSVRSVCVNNRPQKIPEEPMATKAIVGTKIGMTQVWDEENRLSRGHCARCSPMSRGAEAGHFAKGGVAPGPKLVELRLDDVGDIAVGDELTVEQLAAGELVDVTAVSKGKGFAGVMKRHNFKGMGASHGAHRNHRKPGAIGQCATPSRVFRGKKMPGRMGAEKVTTQNLQVVQADPERELLLVRGSVPGPRGATVVIRNAVKKPAFVASEANDA